MTGTVYADALKRRDFARLIPDEATRSMMNDAIFDELCQGVFKPETTAGFVKAIDVLGSQGADCVILGCTEIPLIISESNSSLPVLDSTRLLAKYAVKMALLDGPLQSEGGWLNLPEH